MAQKIPLDETRINIDHDGERLHWAKTLGCSEDDLRGAVDLVGPQLDAVRKHLCKPQWGQPQPE
jgi:hypothetical protein